MPAAGGLTSPEGWLVPMVFAHEATPFGIPAPRAGDAPTPARRSGPLLADEFFWLAHQALTGQPRIHGRATGIGLAGGLLGELILTGHLFLGSGVLTVLNPASPADVLAHSTLDQIEAEPLVRDVRTWLAFLAGEAEDAVAQRMCREGFVVGERARWPRSSVRYVPVDGVAPGRPATRLYMALTRDEPLSVSDVVLAGLVAAVGLTRTVLFDGGSRGAASIRRLQQRVGWLPAPLGELVAHVEAAVGDLVLTHRG
jgi:hypothetical protein